MIVRARAPLRVSFAGGEPMSRPTVTTAAERC